MTTIYKIKKISINKDEDIVLIKKIYLNIYKAQEYITHTSLITTPAREISK